MDLKEKVLNKRMDEFGLAKQTFICEHKDTFPNCIDVVKWEKTEPRKVYAVELNDYILSTDYCFVIGTLEWDSHEPCWDFKSCGTRYLEYGTEELNKWLLDFCNTYGVDEDNELYIKTKEDK